MDDYLELCDLDDEIYDVLDETLINHEGTIKENKMASEEHGNNEQNNKQRKINGSGDPEFFNESMLISIHEYSNVLENRPPEWDETYEHLNQATMSKYDHDNLYQKLLSRPTDKRRKVLIPLLCLVIFAVLTTCLFIFMTGEGAQADDNQGRSYFILSFF